MSNFLGEGGLRTCKEGVLQSWSFDGWNEFTLGTSSWSVFSQLFSLFKIAVSKLQILNMPIRTLLFFFIIVMYDIVKGLYSSNFAHIIAFFLEFNFFNVYDILILTNKKAKQPFQVSVDWSYYLLKY